MSPLKTDYTPFLRGGEWPGRRSAERRIAGYKPEERALNISSIAAASIGPPCPG
jgi:hypothetical protein